MDIKKIIVHPKTFHPDEIAGLAFIFLQFPFLRSVPLKRVIPNSDELSDPRVLVIDTGERYQPELNNFDHHQDKSLPCASTLLWRHFFPERTDQERQLKRVMDILFFRSIDRHDRGIAFAGGNSIGNAISAMNFLPDGFNLAINYAELTLQAFIAKQKETLPVRNFWHQGNSFGGSRRLRVFNEYLPVAIRDKVIRYAESKKKALFLLWPVSDDGKLYILRTVNDNQIIPADKRQVDIDGVSAVYASKKDALSHALELAARKFEKDRYWYKIDSQVA